MASVVLFQNMQLILYVKIKPNACMWNFTTVSVVFTFLEKNNVFKYILELTPEKITSQPLLHENSSWGSWKYNFFDVC